jgi:hypothetical protein
MWMSLRFSILKSGMTKMVLSFTGLTNRQDTLFGVGRSMFNVERSSFMILYPDLKHRAPIPFLSIPHPFI